MNAKIESRKLIWFVIGIALIVLGATVVDIPGLSKQGLMAIDILLVGIILWSTEAVPVPITAMFMVALIPLFGILPFNDAWSATMNSLILFLVGTFGFTVFIKHSTVAPRLIAAILKKSGTDPKKIIIGFMIVSAVISMVMSNVALTALMMALADQLLKESDVKEGESNLGRAMAIAVPWGVVCGSMITPCGGPINLVVMGIVEKSFGISITFAQWVSVAIIPAIVLIVCIWLGCVLVFKPEPLTQDAVDKVIADASALPPLTGREKANIAVIIITLILWIAGSWVAILNSTAVALLALTAMFIPRLRVIEYGDFLKESPWGILLMLMAVNAVVAAMTKSGAVDWLVNGVLGGVANLPWLETMAICTIVVVLVHNVIASGPAVAGLVTVPFVGFMIAAGGNVTAMAVSIAMASCVSYLLPLDAVNLVSYSSYKYIKFWDMAKVGWIPTIVQIILCVFLMPAMCFAMGLA